MKTPSLIVGLSLFPLGAPLLPAEEPAGLAPELAEVAEALHMGGVHFSVTNIDGDLESYAGVVDRILDKVREQGEEVPEEFDAVKIVQALGVDHIRAMGQSAHREGHAWQNRAYLATAGKREGLLSLWGGEPGAFVAPTFASANADLVLEAEVNLGEAASLARGIAGAISADAQAEVDAVLRDVVPGGVLTTELFLKMFKVRASLAATLLPDQRLPMGEGVDLPGVLVVGRIDRANWIWANYRGMIEEDAVREDKDGLVMLLAPEVMDTPMGPIRPVIAFEEATGALWVAMREEDLREARGDGPKLAAHPDFLAATKGLPEQGNALAFTSARFGRELTTVLKSAVATGLDKVGDVFGTVSEDVTGRLEHPYAAVISNRENGVLFAMNAPFAQKGGSMLGAPATVALLAGFSTPMVMKARENAGQVRDVANARQVMVALMSYAVDNGSGFPAELQTLVEGGYLTAEALALLTTLESGEMTYIPGRKMTDDPSSVVLYSSPDEEGNMIVAFLDGSVQVLPEAQVKVLVEKD